MPIPSSLKKCVCWVALLLITHASEAASGCPHWPLWQQFKTLYVSDDGRVIDRSTAAQITTSEGQAYALLFALIANDRASFDRLLQWTEDNLAAGSLQSSLPAWQWGLADDDTWRVLDNNAASDADLWMAYALFEAGRLWRDAKYTALGEQLAQHILRDEVTLIPGLGLTLLPGPRGFVEPGIWRLNASYAPLQVLSALAEHTRNALWREIARSTRQVIMGSAPHGYVADWIEYSSNFMPDRSTRGVGSYDAIRVYLWLGMLASDTARADLNRKLSPVLDQFKHQAAPFTRVDTNTLAMQGKGSPGFSAALLPMLANAKLHATLSAQVERVRRQALQNNQWYFSDALSLFGLGWLDGWYTFTASGLLSLKWKASCGAQ